MKYNSKSDLIMAKRFNWKGEEIIYLLDYLINRHEDFKRMKKLNQSSSFYSNLVKDLRLATDEATVKSLLKNLGTEYRSATRVMGASGAETTDGELRNSTDLFNKYTSYYEVYFPKGGTIKPPPLAK